MFYNDRYENTAWYAFKIYEKEERNNQNVIAQKHKDFCRLKHVIWLNLNRKEAKSAWWVDFLCVIIARKLFYSLWSLENKNVNK